MEAEKQKELFEAFFKAQQKIKQPFKNKQGEIEGDEKISTFMYSDLPSVLEAINKACEATGLGFTQLPYRELESGDTGIRTILIHKSGGSFDCGGYTMPRDTAANMNLSQMDGSLITYLRRYTLMAIFGIAGIDDMEPPVAGNQELYKPGIVSKNSRRRDLENDLKELAELVNEPLENVKADVLGAINYMKNTNFTDFEEEIFQDAYQEVVKQKAAFKEEQENVFEWGE